MQDQAHVVIIGGGIFGRVTSGVCVHGAGKAMVQGYLRKDIANYDSGWSLELLGAKLVAKRQKFPIFAANASRTCS